ncbi:hypothetical protein [Spiroplasma endosymbiont of Dactylopius coccus]
MIILPTLFENKDEIEILSPFPKAIHTSNDIRTCLGSFLTYFWLN